MNAAPRTRVLPEPYYEDDAVTIYHGDCRAVLPSLRADAVVTDPPYGVGKDYGPNYDDGLPDYWDFMRGFVALARAAAPVVAMTQRVLALRELEGWDWVAGWVKQGPQMRLFSMPVLPTWEPILLWGIKGLDVRHVADTFLVDAIVPGDSGHPFPKPPALMGRIVTWLTDPGQRIIDPFMGSGTTLRAAKDHGRRAIGIEIEERYCEIAALRCAQDVLDLRVPAA